MTSPGQKEKLAHTDLCQIIRELSYEENLTDLKLSIDRLHDLESAIDWALSRGPETFHHVEDDYYLWKTEELTGFPSVRIAYHFNKQSRIIKLISIELSN